MGKKNNYFIIGQERWGFNKIKYRRHRIAEYLINHSATNQVYWIAPYQTTWKKALKLNKNISVEKMDNGIICLNIPEFKGLIGHLGIFNIRKVLKRFYLKTDNNFIWYTYPSFWTLTKKKSKEITVYDCSDLWTSANWPSNNRKNDWMRKIYLKLLEFSETKIIKRSHYLFATSNILKERMSKSTNRQIRVIENGVDVTRFNESENPVPELQNIPSPRIVFSGGLKKKIDVTLIKKTAEEFPNVSIVIVGPIGEGGQEVKELNEQKNVYFTGEKRSELIPDYLKKMDIGIMPYKNIDYNKAVSPLKLFEYLAANLIVVGHGVPSTKNYEEKGIYYYSESYEEFLRDVKDALNTNNKNYSERRKELVGNQDWNKKIDLMMKVVLERK